MIAYILKGHDILKEENSMIEEEINNDWQIWNEILSFLQKLYIEIIIFSKAEVIKQQIVTFSINLGKATLVFPVMCLSSSISYVDLY